MTNSNLREPAGDSRRRGSLPEKRPTVAADEFTAAAERKHEALAAYYVVKEQWDEAERALNALSCRASFTYEVPGEYPEDSDDGWVVEEECTLQAGHAGEHRGDFDASATAGPAYLHAVRRFQEVTRYAGDEQYLWEDAEEALEALRCNQGPASEWPCIRRSGHDGEHEHLSQLHLVI